MPGPTLPNNKRRPTGARIDHRGTGRKANGDLRAPKPAAKKKDWFTAPPTRGTRVNKKLFRPAPKRAAQPAPKPAPKRKKSLGGSGVNGPLFNPKFAKPIQTRFLRRENARAKAELLKPVVKRDKIPKYVRAPKIAPADQIVVPLRADKQGRTIAGRVIARPRLAVPRMVDPLSKSAKRAVRKNDERVLRQQDLIIAKDKRTVIKNRKGVGEVNTSVQRLRDFGEVSGKSRSRLALALAGERRRQKVAQDAARKRAVDAATPDALDVVVGAIKEATVGTAKVIARNPARYISNPLGFIGTELAAEAAKQAPKVIGEAKPLPAWAKTVQTAGLSLGSEPSELSKRIKTTRPENLLRLIDQTQRPINAIAGAELSIARDLKRGKGVNWGKAAKEGGKGLSLKTRHYTSDVLKEIGITGPVGAALGFVGDVAQDPTTYLTLGVGAVAVTGAKAAAKKAAQQAFKASLKESGWKSGVRGKLRPRRSSTVVAKDVAVARAARRAQATYKKTLAAESKKSGYHVSAGTRNRRVRVNVPAPKRFGEKPVDTPGAGVSRKAASAFRPTAPPASDIHPAEWLSGLNVNREVRAASSKALGHAQIAAELYTKKVKKQHYTDFIHAVETNNPSALPEYLTKPSIRVRVLGPSARAGVAGRAAKDTAARKVVGFKKISIYDATKSELKRAEKLRKRAGQQQGSVRDYFPHMLSDVLEPAKKGRFRKAPLKSTEQITSESNAAALQHRGAASASRRAGSTLGRKLRTTVRSANEQMAAAGKGVFSENVPLVMATYHAQTGNILKQAKFNEGVSRFGREVKITPVLKPVYNKGKSGAWEQRGVAVRKSAKVGAVAPTERVYVHVLDKGEINGVKAPGRAVVREASPAELRDLAKGRVPANVRRITVADKRVFDRAAEGFTQHTVVPQKLAAAHANGHQYQVVVWHAIDSIYDPLSRAWKGIATRTPGFHMRNMYGDTSMAYNVVPGHLMPQLTTEALKVTWFLRGQRGNLLGFTKRDKFITVNKESVSLTDWSNELIDNGVIIGGVLGSDLESIARHGASGVGLRNGKLKRLGRGIDRTLQDRENVMRMTVYKHFRDKGHSAIDSARESANAMIDYGELTAAEKEVFKRLSPFYIFAARSIPMFALTFVKRPGKLGNIEKLRQEVARAQGLDANDLKSEQTYRQRAYGFPVKMGGKTEWWSFGLPLTALNNLPAGLDIETTINNNVRFWASSFNPLIGSGLEALMNKSFFYGKPLEPEYKGNKVPAPVPGVVSWVADLLGSDTSSKVGGGPNESKTLLGVGPLTNKKTGKTVVGYRGKADNTLAKFTPGIPGFGLNLTRGSNRRGQSTAQQFSSILTGVKRDPGDPVAGQLEKAYKLWGEYDKRIKSLQQQGKTESAAAALAKKVGADQRKLQDYINKLETRQGSAFPSFGTKKSSGRSGGLGGGGLSSGGLGGGGLR